MGKSITSIYLDNEVLEELQKRAKKIERTQTWLLMQAITTYLTDPNFSGLIDNVAKLEDEIQRLQEKQRNIGKLAGGEIKQGEVKTPKVSGVFADSDMFKRINPRLDVWERESQNWRENKEDYLSGKLILEKRFKNLLHSGDLPLLTTFEEYKRVVGAN